MYYTLIDFEVQFGNTVNFRYLYNVHNRADSRDVIFRARSFYSGTVQYQERIMGATVCAPDSTRWAGDG